MNFIHTEDRIYYENDSKKLLAEVRFPLKEVGVVEINRTFVDPSLRGQGVANLLLEAAYKQLKLNNLSVIPTCSYALVWFKRNTDKQDILKDNLDLDQLKEECAI